MSASTSTFAFATYNYYTAISSTPTHQQQQRRWINNKPTTTTHHHHHQLASSSSSATRNISLSSSSSSSAYQQQLEDDYYGSTSVTNKKPLIMIRTRREAMGGLCLMYLLTGGLNIFQNVIFPEQPAQAAEESELRGGQSCDEFTVTPSGLQFCDQVIGTGPVPSKGQLIKAHYVGKLENGKVFDSSYSRGKPLTFRVGVGEVIKGWDQGILGGDGIPPMLAGGKRRLKLPSELGYGMRGAGCKGGSCIIPPNSTLLFDVEFVGKA